MRAAIVLAGALGALPPAAAQQDGTLQKIRDTGSITLGHRDASIPFSYYDRQQLPVGYAIDLCLRIVEAARAELGLERIAVKYQLVTPVNRVPLMRNGTIDLECGSTTNTLERQKQVAFGLTHFVAGNRVASKRAAGIRGLEDLRGRTVVSTAGTTSIERFAALNARRGLGARLVAANGHPEAFLMLETDRAAAFVMDDVLLHGLVAGSRSPRSYVISAEALSVEPYGIMLRRSDPAFKNVVDAALRGVYRSGQIDALYRKWFLSPIPPGNVNLAIPMSPQLKRVLANPTDSGNEDDYR